MNAVQFPSSNDLAGLRLVQYLNLKLALLGQPMAELEGGDEVVKMAATVLAHQRENQRLLATHLSPADQRTQNFLYEYFQEIEIPRLPSQTLVLDRPGMAAALSLPAQGDSFTSPVVQSYRVRQGVLHNPKSDRRTTQGIFHVVEGGLPVPDDKLAVPKIAFARLLASALQPPDEFLTLPFTSAQAHQARCFVSLYLRPLVAPEIPEVAAEKRLEIRFFVPGGLVGNLHFLEEIFGNAGDPYLPENDAGLDPIRWTGHTGCVILAPHLVTMTKRAAGLPPWEKATERQRRDGMCWKKEDELYNGGGAFKLTCRDASGAIVTMIADNYFGYCKKEVKTQISFSANLAGRYEEEHAGGALVYPAYDLGAEFSGGQHVQSTEHSFAEAVRLLGPLAEVRPKGYAVDRRYSPIVYVPENVRFDLRNLAVKWDKNGFEQTIKLLHGNVYVLPSGYKVYLEPTLDGRTWRLVGTVAEGLLCHKPCTVSGGGKSEISKSINDAILQGPTFVADFQRDMDAAADLLERDYSKRFRDSNQRDARPLLSPERSLGSVIKLLTPDEGEYTAEYNQWLAGIPHHVKELVYVIKRFYKPSWGQAWRERFSVNMINGTPGNELRCNARPLVSQFLRVGYAADGSWRTFGLRQDFHPAAKIQREDDITASVVVPTAVLPEAGPEASGSCKFVENCERRLFQRPDDAIHPGYDRQTESDFAGQDCFFSNYQPLTGADAAEMLDDAITLARFTPPMQTVIREMARAGGDRLFVCPAHPRLVDGKPSKNPRYLQMRPDLLRPAEVHLAEVSTRLKRRIPFDRPLYQTVGAVLPGRRNNPPEAGIRSLAVFNPIHYLELPELFMEFISSMTGKSPSTTGAGSEGALTKGPFNALPPVLDLNAALVSWILCESSGFISAAGYVGPKVRVDHDLSLLMPELWCRLTPEERNPAFLIERQYLDRCADFTFEGRVVPASRLGYRINERFARVLLGRIFNHPQLVFTEEMLKPELQDLAVFADGMANIAETHRRVAENYFADGSIEWACPPLRALLHIMRDGRYEGMDLLDVRVRGLFTRPALLASDWYQARLDAQMRGDAAIWKRHVQYLEKFLSLKTYAGEAARLDITSRLAEARRQLESVSSPASRAALTGYIGLDPAIAPK